MKAVLTASNDVNHAVLLTARFYGCEVLATLIRELGAGKL